MEKQEKRYVTTPHFTYFCCVCKRYSSFPCYVCDNGDKDMECLHCGTILRYER